MLPSISGQARSITLAHHPSLPPPVTHFRVSAPGKIKKKNLKSHTQTLVGLTGAGPLPGPVIVEGLAAVTLGTLCVVLAVAHQLLLLVLHAARRVPIALAAPADLQLPHCIVIGGRAGAPLLLASIPAAQIAEQVRTAEDHTDVGGRHPVLEHRAAVEVLGGGSPIKCAEGNEPTGEGVEVGEPISAEGLLLVLLGDSGFAWFAIDLTALGGVVLVRHPGLAIVHGFEDGSGLRPG